MLERDIRGDIERIKSISSSIAGKKLVPENTGFRVWFSRKKSSYMVDAKEFGRQTILASGPGKPVEKSIEYAIDELNMIQGISIKLSKRRKADIRIYFDKDIDLGDGFVYRGYALEGGANKWELFINTSENRSHRSLVFATLHELGHALGLVHADSKSKTVVFPKDSVMSTQKVKNLRQPIRYQAADLFAINSIHGISPAMEIVDAKCLKPTISLLQSRRYIVKNAQNCDQLTGCTNDIVIDADSKLLAKGKGEPFSDILINVSNVMVGKTRVTKSSAWSLPILLSETNIRAIGAGHSLEVTQVDPFGEVEKVLISDQVELI